MAEWTADPVFIIAAGIALLLLAATIILAVLFAGRGAKLHQAELLLVQKAGDDKSWQGDINALEQDKIRAQTELNEIERAEELLSGKRRQIQAELAEAQKAAGLPLPPAEGEIYVSWLRRREAAELKQAAAEQFMRDKQPLWQQAEALLAKLRALNAAMPFMPDLSGYFPAWLDAAKRKIAANYEAEQNLRAAEKERDALAEQLREKQAKLAGLTAQAAQAKTDWQSKINALFSGRLNAEMAKNISALQVLADAERQARQLLADRRVNADLLAQTLKQLPAEEAEQLKPGVIDAAVEQAEQEQQENLAAFGRAVQAHTEAQTNWDNIAKEDETAQLAQRKMTLGLELQDLLQNYAEQSLGLKLAQQALASYRERHRSGMMKATERAFAALTNGAYPRLQTSLEGNDEVLQAVPRDGGGLKRADAMSKGTRFQLYMALRAAAYEQLLARNINLPFFCDDVFETFDDARTEAACRLMQHIGRQGQAIYLTHHRHVTDIARKVCGAENVQIHEL